MFAGEFASVVLGKPLESLDNDVACILCRFRHQCMAFASQSGIPDLNRKSLPPQGSGLAKFPQCLIVHNGHPQHPWSTLATIWGMTGFSYLITSTSSILILPVEESGRTSGSPLIVFLLRQQHIGGGVQIIFAFRKFDHPGPTTLLAIPTVVATGRVPLGEGLVAPRSPACSA